MTTRLLAAAALLLLAGSASYSMAQEQTADGQCNCPKCQAARQAAMDDASTLAAQPAGLFSAEPVGLFAPTVSAPPPSAPRHAFSAEPRGLLAGVSEQLGTGDFFEQASVSTLFKSQQTVAREAAGKEAAFREAAYREAAARQAAYNEAAAREVQQAGHQYAPDGPYIRNPGPGPGSHGRRPGASSYGSGTFPNGSPYDHFYAGRPFDGGRYGYFGGAHRTPGYPHHHHHREFVGPQGPPSAQVAYPYYTIRGPRDFLMDNPPSIGR